MRFRLCLLSGGLISLMAVGIAMTASAEATFSDVPQAVVDQLSGEGYSYSDIVEAYELAIYFGSSPVALAQFKPAELAWNEYDLRLKTYLWLRQAMLEIDRDDSLNEAERVAAKDRVLLRGLGTGRAVLDMLTANGLTAEESLGVLTLAAIKGIPEEQLLILVAESPAAEGNARAELRQVLAGLDALIGWR